MILQATHTHLYPGHRGTIPGVDELSDAGKARDCVVEFSDGSAAPASLRRIGDIWQLETQPYRTAAGTDIEAKRWRIDLSEGSDGLAFRILATAGSP